MSGSEQAGAPAGYSGAKSKNLAEELNLNEVFSLGYIQLNNFSKKLSELKKKRATEKKPFKTIDFSREGYITDAAIKILVNVLGKESFSEVDLISFEGCSAVTDIGLHWLVQVLEGNKANVTVNINGCTNVTDSGFATLLNCPRINNIKAIATSVSHFSNGSNTRGCPLLTDSSCLAPSHEVQKESYLLIVPIGTKESLSECLISSKIEERKALHYHKEATIQDWNFNVVEVERSHVLFQHLLPPNPVHVFIPFDASLDLNTVKGQIEETIAHVLSKEQPNPPHREVPDQLIVKGCNGWLDCSQLARVKLSMDGTLRNISLTAEALSGCVTCKQTMSRTNNYFEVKVTEGCKFDDTAVVAIGVIFDLMYCLRFPTDSKEAKGMATEGLPMREGVTYGFGVKGDWLSEYVPGPDAEFYITENGKTIPDKALSEKPKKGMCPIIMIDGNYLGAVCIQNMLTPPEDVQQMWIKKQMYHTPAYAYNVLCDDQGIISYLDSKESKHQYGWIQMKEDITDKNNVFAIRVVKKIAKGAITMGFGPENYPLGSHPGWKANSFALHGDNGKLYRESSSGSTPQSGDKPQPWEEGDVIKMVITNIRCGEVITSGAVLTIDFYINDIRIIHTTFTVKDYKRGNRILFMVGMHGKNSVAEIINFRPVYLSLPPKMNKLTMGRCHFMDIMDDGTLTYGKANKMISLYVSRTPFNKQLLYFEVKFRNSKATDTKNVGIGLCHKAYGLNKKVGNQAGSIGYHGGNEVFIESYDNAFGESDSSLNNEPLKDGDVLGCGIDATRAVFRPDGTLGTQQMLHVYFTRCGTKVWEGEFFYRSDGLFPAIHCHSNDVEVQLVNYYPGPEPGNSTLISDTVKVGVKKTAGKSFIEGCQFTVVGMGPQESNPKGKTESLEKKMANGPQFTVLPLIEKKIGEMEKKLASMDTQEQQQYASLLWQKECLQQFAKTKSRLNFISVDTSSSEKLSVKSLHNMVLKSCGNDLEMHPNFYKQPKTLTSTLENVTKLLKSDKLFSARYITSQVDTKYSNNFRTIEMILQFLQMKGRIMWVPLKGTVVPVDMTFAETIVGMLEKLPTTSAGNKTPYIGADTKVWKQIDDIAADIKPPMRTKPDLTRGVLRLFGLIEIPCVRMNIKDPKFYYGTTKGLGELPVNLDDFINEGKDDVIIFHRDYRFFYNRPEDVLSMIISQCALFSRPVAIASTWCVFQTGAAQIAIYVKDQDLIIESRCFMPSSETNTLNQDTKSNVEEYSWNIFCMFIDIIDLSITSLRIKVTYTQKVPAGLRMTSIGCLHKWGLSDEPYRQTRCTLCHMCCEKGSNCEYNGVPGTYEPQCGCGTIVTGCTDCGICKKCADSLWTIRSSLRPNLEVSSYGDIKSSQLIPLNDTTYNEVEITNLGRNHAPICLSSFSDFGSSWTLMYPGLAMEVPSVSAVQKTICSTSTTAADMRFGQGDIVTLRLDPVKTDNKVKLKQDKIVVRASEPVYFTSICRDISVWHDTGILGYTSLSSSFPAGQFIAAMPLTPEVNSFSFEIINQGKNRTIGIGVCPKRYAPARHVGWNKGSYGYHADDGGLFLGTGSASKRAAKCIQGDIMKCEIDFKNKFINFYKNNVMIHKTEVQNTSGLHAAVGLKSKGEAVRLLEKEPWSVKEMEMLSLPTAFNSYKYGNMYISPGSALTLYKSSREMTAWLMLHNPSKNVVGFKILLPENIRKEASFLEPGQTYAQNLSFNLEIVKTLPNVDIHWFVLESGRDYSKVSIEEIYQAIRVESLLMHRLNMTVRGQSDLESLKLVANSSPAACDGYNAEVIKNGISIRKYWLKDDSHVICIPLESEVLVRYPKFPTLDYADSLQKGMRLIVDLSATEKDTFAEGLIQEVTPSGVIKLEYSLAGKNFNSTMEIPTNSPLINLKKIRYEEVLKATPTKEKKESEDGDGETTLEAALNILSYEPRGNTTAIKCAYKFAPFHLLTKASQDALRSLDSSWESTTLQSVASCKTTPTRATVQELQIADIAEDDLDWLVGANPSRKYDVAFAFLPSQLGLKSLCYPSVPSMFNNIDVHRLCLQTDQMKLGLALYKEQGILTDMPLHFANIQPITPSPELTADTKYTSAFNAWVYSTLYLNKLLLPKYDNMFHEGDSPGLERQQLEQMMKALVHIYASQCHLFAEQHGGIASQETPEKGTDTISNSIKHNNELVVREPEKVEMADDVLLKPFKQKNNAFCKAHLYCTEGAAIVEEVVTMRIEQIQPYEETINIMHRKMPGLMTLPATFFSHFVNLQYLKLTNCDKLHIVPNGISQCKRLEYFCMESSAVVQLPEDFFEAPSMTTVHCDGLLVQTLPAKVLKTCQIRELKLCSMQLQTVPPELGLLVSLEVLNLDSNPLIGLPLQLKTLSKLKSLHLCGIKWLSQGGSKTELTINQKEEFLDSSYSLTNFLGRKKALDLFAAFNKKRNSHDSDEVAELNSHFFWNIPRLGGEATSDSKYGGMPPVIFLLTSLENLYLDYQAITFVHDYIGRLQNLKVLSISHNPLLERLSGALGHSPSLKSIRVIGNPSLQTPPHEIYSRGFMAVKSYLKRLAEGLSECRRTKLMFVGLGGAGKTSLLKSLMSLNKKLDTKTKEEVTDGIMIAPWTVKTSNGVEITYSTWDFAGQTLYYNTHQFFLSKRAVYLLLWSARQGFEHSGVEFWLNSIASHTSEAPIFIISTHCDEVPQATLPKEVLKKRYPQIAGFFFISSKTGSNIPELEKEMLRVTLAQKNMGEQVPQVWLNLEKKILAARHQNDILDWDIIKQFSIDVGLYDEKDIREAISFLNELGTVQYFDTDFLRHKIVINPQWIVNVMACVVSVKDSPIQDQLGRFLHKDIPKIWSTYDPKLHSWLLQLTEEFDLTFPLPREEVNIVPCILPQEQPDEFDWPIPDHEKNMKETKIVYKFEFLPAGLFNRAQVRLFQLSDGKLMWKNGSLLNKNRHLALVEQITDTELVVKVQGPRPENVIFLIHEIFESLIDESFKGVHYDFMVPCPDCIEKELSLEPSLFEGYLIRKASEFRAPFLQCRKYFHTVSMTQLLEIMPSNSTTDFDAHLQASLQILQELNNAFTKDVAILCCPKDAKSSDCISPEKVKVDLEAVGFSCWVSEDVAEHELMMAVKNCRILVVLCSDNFEHDKKFRDTLLYSMDSLKKTFVIVAVGSSMDWMNTNMGMRIGKQELMVMIPNKSKYNDKISEMRNLVEIKLSGLNQKSRKYCSVFVSYCWENSTIAKNGETKQGCAGWGDPRSIKQQLEERNISCWLDVENIASCSGENKGLFQTIAEGMNNTKVVLVCISDEYIKSENCMRELRFAVLNLKKPVVFAVVGTGKRWKKSEAELLRGDSISSEMTVSFQSANEKGVDELASFIRRLLPNNAEQVIQKEAIQKDMESMQAKEKETKKSGSRKLDKEAMQEECELVQRKFMRYVISYVSSQDTVLAPRLFVFDFEKSAQSDGSDLSDDPSRSSRARTSRPKTANRSSRSVMMPVKLEEDTDFWEAETMCIKLLCENEQGWHVCKKLFPIKQTEEIKGMMQGCSAYLARMYAILRQSNVMLNCFEGPKGEKFLSWIEEIVIFFGMQIGLYDLLTLKEREEQVGGSAVNDVNFVEAFTTIRSELVEDDGAKKFLAQLNRYHLPTGKIYWLCEEHSKGPRIVHLSTETVSTKEGMKMLEDEDVKMGEHVEKALKERKEKMQGEPQKASDQPDELKELELEKPVEKSITIVKAPQAPEPAPTSTTSAPEKVAAVAEQKQAAPSAPEQAPIEPGVDDSPTTSAASKAPSPKTPAKSGKAKGEQAKPSKDSSSSSKTCILQ